jgi:protein Tex
MNTIAQRIAEALSVRENQVQSAISLLDAGATVPFIARYRKEVTEGLDDTQLRNLEERLRYLRELDERRDTILKSIEEQGKLTAELEQAINTADTKTRLEDLYLPFRPKRRTKAQIAKEAGLEPLAIELLQNPELSPETTAHAYLNEEKGIIEIKLALEGAKHILLEKFAEEPELIGELREYLWENGTLNATVVDGKQPEGAKFSDYFEYHEPLKKIPSHRALALFRGRNESILQLNLVVGNNDTSSPHPCESRIAHHFHIQDKQRAADAWLLDAVRAAWKFKIRLSLETELFNRLRETAETEAIKVFAGNLHDLLLAAPAGPRVTMGLDPGLRTGVKVAVIDKTGKLLDVATIYPHPPKNEWATALATLAKLAFKHKVELISIGNGTGSRETDKLINQLLGEHPELKLHKIVVSEAGASVYSASELAANEFPELDVSLRGAVSIARRLQDPLAELVKIDPKSIGVGQYQHDVSQTHLARSLDAVVEDCVNAVGVDVNTASVPLLSRISGLNQGLAYKIVEYRDENGAFRNREQLKQVPRVGAKTFEQAAGFLRIVGGDHPLDASSVHPEAYPVVERIIQKTQKPINILIGNSEFLRNLTVTDFVDDTFGIPTVKDILVELEKPGRDPRPEFKTAHFHEDIRELTDLVIDMVLEGVVTNVTNFGAFIDIGVHQDGLVHISELSQGFVKDPRNVVKAGDVVKVKVMDIDLPRRRVALSMRLDQQSRQRIPPKSETPEPMPQRTYAKPSPVMTTARQPVDRFEKTEKVDKHPPLKDAKGKNQAQTGPFANALAAAFASARKR